jgi:hypothetical protein
MAHFQTKYAQEFTMLMNLSKELEDFILNGKDFLQVIKENEGEYRVIVIMRPKKGVKLFTPELLKRLPSAMLLFNLWIFEHLSHDPQVQVAGLIILNSFKGLSFSEQMVISTMAPMQHQLATFQHFQILGMRFKGGFIFEEPPVMSWIWFFIRPFMSDKIKTRFHLCGGNYEKLRESGVSEAFLPVTFGGTIPDDEPFLTEWIEKEIAADFNR